MDFENILYSVEDRSADHANRPKAKNALSIGLRRDIVDSLRAAERDDDVTLVLIEGSGERVCSGYDLTTDAETFAHVWPGSKYRPVV